MKYAYIKRLGQGSFGEVDEVEDEDGNKLARKTLLYQAHLNIDPGELRKRFEREVRYQSQIDHPNVVRIFYHDLTADPPWFIMELADCSLLDELTDDRTLGGDPRKPLFDILKGLEALHAKGFKHRDLSPANVLKFDSQEESPRYAISDFGLMAPDAGQTSTLTASNMGGGTPLYRAPECAIDFKRATSRSDIYSIGAILHDIFGGGVARIPHVELNVASDVGPIIQKCTKTNVLRRYKNVAELRADLFDFLSNEDIQFSSAEEEGIVNILKSNDTLTDDKWDRVFHVLDENDENNRTNHVIFRSKFLSHIVKCLRKRRNCWRLWENIFPNMPKMARSTLIIAMFWRTRGRLFTNMGSLI